MFSACFYARLQAKLKISHMLDMKLIFWYLHGTKSLGIWYPADDGFSLQAYSDSNSDGLQLDRKGTSKDFLGGRLVRWSSKKQNCIALCTSKSEYIVDVSFTSQVLCMKSQLLDYGFQFKKIPIYCDSTSAIAILHNPIQHSITKHIDLRYHFIKDHIQDGNT